MDIKAYIESGILESYVLGLCNEQESRQVEELCAQYPELKTELDSIRKATESYSAAHSRTVPSSLKQHIFAEISRLEKNEGKPVTQDNKVIQLYSRVRWVAVAAIALFVLSLGMNFILFNRLKNANEEIITLNADKTRMADEFKANNVKLEAMYQERNIMSDPNTVKVMMKGMEKSPQSMAMVYWNKKSQKVFIEVKSLPMPEKGKQYQLWAIVDGKPVDAGMITMEPGDSTLHPMKDFATAQAFAITLEKEGGNPTPTMSEMYVMGAINL